MQSGHTHSVWGGGQTGNSLHVAQESSKETQTQELIIEAVDSCCNLQPHLDDNRVRSLSMTLSTFDGNQRCCNNNSSRNNNN